MKLTKGYDPRKDNKVYGRRITKRGTSKTPNITNRLCLAITSFLITFIFDKNLLQQLFKRKSFLSRQEVQSIVVYSTSGVHEISWCPCCPASWPPTWNYQHSHQLDQSMPLPSVLLSGYCIMNVSQTQIGSEVPFDLVTPFSIIESVFDELAAIWSVCL